MFLIVFSYTVCVEVHGSFLNVITLNIENTGKYKHFLHDVIRVTKLVYIRFPPLPRSSAVEFLKNKRIIAFYTSTKWAKSFLSFLAWRLALPPRPPRPPSSCRPWFPRHRGGLFPGTSRSSRPGGPAPCCLNEKGILTTLYLYFSHLELYHDLGVLKCSLAELKHMTPNIYILYSHGQINVLGGG